MTVQETWSSIIIWVCFLIVSRNGSGASRVSDELSCPGNLKWRLRMFSGYALSEYPDMPDRESWIVLLSHPAEGGSGCEISWWGGTLAGQNGDCETSGWNEWCHVSQGGRPRVLGRGSHVALFREDPTLIMLESPMRVLINFSSVRKKPLKSWPNVTINI